jgi:hypothetical protein
MCTQEEIENRRDLAHEVIVRHHLVEAKPKTRPHLMFPRLSAIAETGWTSVANKNFARFIHLCGLMPTFENAPCSLTLSFPGRNGPL